jgi:hypothetical protein
MPAEQLITLILKELAALDRSVLDRSMPLVFTELRNLAGTSGASAPAHAAAHRPSQRSLHPP